MADEERPSLDLVRQLTDRQVLGQLIAEVDLTRAELAARTGISKPTVSESIRRLSAAGLVVEGGKQSGKRGPSGTYYRLRADVGCALAVTIGPDGVVAETADLRGTTLRRAGAQVPGPVSARDLAPVLRGLVDDALRDVPGRPIGSCVNVAGPVDQRSQVLVRLPNSPYFSDDFDPVQSFRDRIGPAVLVDNDVNWAVAAELAEGRGRGHGDVLYGYLGPGIGSAIVAAGSLVRGHRGLAGELANVLTHGPGGRATRLADCFAAWGLRQPGTEAIDLDRISAALTDDGDPGGTREAIATAVAGALCSLAAALDPELILLGGPWSGIGGLDARIAELVAADGVTEAAVGSAALGPDAAHRGARAEAIRLARAELLRRASAD